MTHPTKAVYGMLLRDFAKLTRAQSDEGLYTERDVDASLERIEVIDFHQTITVNGIQVRMHATFVGSHHGWQGTIDQLQLVSLYCECEAMLINMSVVL